MKGIGAEYYTVHTPADNHTYIPENYIYVVYNEMIHRNRELIPYTNF
jgi:hypothetical protein